MRTAKSLGLFKKSVLTTVVSLDRNKGLPGRIILF
jgi:hypothetical protein